MILAGSKVPYLDCDDVLYRYSAAKWKLSIQKHIISTKLGSRQHRQEGLLNTVGKPFIEVLF